MNVQNYLFEQNVHWQNHTYDAGTERALLTSLTKFMDLDQILAISGIRRCGKSFLLKQIINGLLHQGVSPENILFVNLELPAFIGQSAPKVLDQIFETWQKIHHLKGRLYIFLDEIQTLPQWEAWLKYHYDLNKGKYKFFITGSNSQLLSAEFASLLSGRIIEKRLFPFSFKECLDFKTIQWKNPQQRALNRIQIKREFDRYLHFGGMPETLPVEYTEIKRELLSSYFNAILYRDIIPRFGVREGTLLNEVAIYLLGHASDVVNISKLAQYFKINRVTLGDFIRYLTLSYLLVLTSRFSFSAKTRELSQRKCYTLDTGFANLLPLRFSPDHGKLLENLVLIELLRRDNKVFFWRNSNECDFIIETPDGIRKAIQVCYELTPSNRSRELKGLLTAGQAVKADEVMILTLDSTDRLEIEQNRVDILPVSDWMLSE
ncbi:AAA family ATPase [candidate division KSB1 bacterium]|nr:AAA family ATPase [candidate division KSB1 bacterium]